MTGTNLFSKGWKFLTTVTKHFYTLSYSDSVKQVLTKFLAFWHKRRWGPKTIDFQQSFKIRLSCFFRQIKPPKKEFWIQANVFESNFTFQANAVWNQTQVFFLKKYVVWSQVKMFWARWRDKILPRQRAQKNDCFFFVASKAKAFAVLPIFGGTSKDKIDDQYKFILQKMKVSYDHYETLLHNFATNSVRQVLAKFLHLSLKELWT